VKTTKLSCHKRRTPDSGFFKLWILIIHQLPPDLTPEYSSCYFKKMKFKPRTAILALLILGLGAYLYRASTFRPIKNFHVVDPGKFYRSAQLTGDELREVVAEKGIKTVINLRGRQRSEWWYQDEKAVLDELGVNFVSIPLDSDTVPKRKRLIRYLNALRDLPRPILIHCRSGADRTGLHSALYKIDYMGKTTEEAFEELDARFLHFKSLKPSNSVFLKNYKGENWARTEYSECLPEFIDFAERKDKCK
jgi:protein tyrosine/serine phosphatase